MNGPLKIVWCPLHQEWVVQVGGKSVGQYPRLLEAEYAAIALGQREEVAR